MSDIVERLRDGVVDLPRMGIKGVRASITAADLEEAAAEIERLRDERYNRCLGCITPAEHGEVLDALEARLAEAVEVIEWLVECFGEEDKRIIRARAFLAKLEPRPVTPDEDRVLRAALDRAAPVVGKGRS